MRTRRSRKRNREFTLITWNKALLLTGLFIALKFLGVIHWSWWWVFSPLWITAIITTALFLLGILALLIVFQVIGRLNLKSKILLTFVRSITDED